ncbi:unnamed protein product, partial [Choristocarpus tenellus]
VPVVILRQLTPTHDTLHGLGSAGLGGRKVQLGRWTTIVGFCRHCIWIIIVVKTTWAHVCIEHERRENAT